MLFCTQTGSVGWAAEGHTAPVPLHFSPKNNLPVRGSCPLELITFPALPLALPHSLSAPGPGGQLRLDPEPGRAELRAMNCFPKERVWEFKIRHLWGPGCGFESPGFPREGATSLWGLGQPSAGIGFPYLWTAD